MQVIAAVPRGVIFPAAVAPSAAVAELPMHRLAIALVGHGGRRLLVSRRLGRLGAPKKRSMTKSWFVLGTFFVNFSNFSIE